MGSHFLLQGDLLDPGLEPTPALQADSLPLSQQGSPMIQAVGDLVPTLRHFNYLILTVTLQIPPLSSWGTDAYLPEVTERQDSTQSLEASLSLPSAIS